MPRTRRGGNTPRKAPYSSPKSRSRAPKKPVSSAPPTPSIESSLLHCQYTNNRDRLTFCLRNETAYTISPADVSPEHFWGTIYSAEFFHPELVHNVTCAIKASDFVLGHREGNDSRAEYRRPRQDFEREVKTFQSVKHRNVLEMYDFWEWEGKGYIAMKKMKGSLGDVLYEPAYQDIVEVLRTNESVLSELAREVNFLSRLSKRLTCRF